MSDLNVHIENTDSGQAITFTDGESWIRTTTPTNVNDHV